MSGYIQVAINKVKAADLEKIKALRKKGHKTIRFRLEDDSKSKKAATASIPILWIVECREKFAMSNKEDAFSNFVSDWVSNWV